MNSASQEDFMFVNFDHDAKKNLRLAPTKWERFHDLKISFLFY